MNIMRYEPNSALDHFLNTDLFFNHAFEDFGKYMVPETGDLKVNIVENEDNYEITAVLPGWDEKDIDLTIKNGQLTLKGTKEEESEKNGTKYRVREFTQRSFVRSFQLGNGVDPEKVTAKLEKGLLKVTLAKKEAAKPKQVKINIDS